jgi:hypothetical protein
MDVVNVQKHQLSILIRIFRFVSSTLGLVGNGIRAWPGICDEQFVGLGIGFHDELQVALILAASAASNANQGLGAAQQGSLLQNKVISSEQKATKISLLAKASYIPENLTLAKNKNK